MEHEVRDVPCPFPRESESEPLTVTPSMNYQQSSKSPFPTTRVVTFLNPCRPNASSSETDWTGNPTKRHTVGSASTLDIRPHTKFKPRNLSYADDTSTYISEDEEQERIQLPAADCISTEFGVDTDIESTTNPGGSTIAQALNLKSREPLMNLSDADATFTTVGLPSTLKDLPLRPSDHAVGL